MANLLNTLSQKIKAALDADIPCWFDYLHESENQK